MRRVRTGPSFERFKGWLSEPIVESKTEVDPFLKEVQQWPH